MTPHCCVWFLVACGMSTCSLEYVSVCVFMCQNFTWPYLGQISKILSFLTFLSFLVKITHMCKHVHSCVHVSTCVKMVMCCHVLSCVRCIHVCCTMCTCVYVWKYVSVPHVCMSPKIMCHFKFLHNLCFDLCVWLWVCPCPVWVSQCLTTERLPSHVYSTSPQKQQYL